MEKLEKINNIFFWINTNSGAEKITFNPGIEGKHYTIRYWNRRRTIDIHSKNEETNEYLTLFEIKVFTLLRLFVQFKNNVPIYLEKYWSKNIINRGKLKHHNCILYPISNVENKFSEYIKVSKNKLKFVKDKNYDKLNDHFLFPEELSESKETLFRVYKVKNEKLLQQGILYKFPNQKSERRFVFMTNKTNNLFQKEMLFCIYKVIENQNLYENDIYILEFMKKINEKYNFNTIKNTSR